MGLLFEYGFQFRHLILREKNDKLRLLIKKYVREDKASLNHNKRAGDDWLDKWKIRELITVVLEFLKKPC